MFVLGKLRLSRPLILAPMSGVSNFPFRMLSRGFGCKCAFLEMIDSRSLSYSNKRTLQMLRTDALDRPLGIQLLGSDPYYIEKGLEKLDKVEFDIIDLNAGCPKKKVTAKGAGASLLKTPRKLQQLLKIIVSYARARNIAATVKIRLGWRDAVSACDIARYAQDSGIDAICVHGRTKLQGYKGNVDYPAIKKLKKALTIPVIASGDILTPQLVKRMLDLTGVDAVMVARGALGNPWIFKDTDTFLKNGKLLPGPGAGKIAAAIKKHFDLCLDCYGERVSIIKFRKFFIWYTRGFSGIKILRTRLVQVKTKAQMFKIIEEFKDIAVP